MRRSRVPERERAAGAALMRGGEPRDDRHTPTTAAMVVRMRATTPFVNRVEEDGSWWAGSALWPLGPSAVVAVPLPVFLF